MPAEVPGAENVVFGQVESADGFRVMAYDIPGGDARDYLSARFKGSERADAWPCTGTVVLHLPASQVLPFAGDGTVEDLGPDRCRYTAGSWSWNALAASLGRFDTAIDVVGPPELTQAFAELAVRNAQTVTAHAKSKAAVTARSERNR